MALPLSNSGGTLLDRLTYCRLMILIPNCWKNCPKLSLCKTPWCFSLAVCQNSTYVIAEHSTGQWKLNMRYFIKSIPCKVTKSCRGSCNYVRALFCQLYPFRRPALWCKRKCWQSWPTAATSPLFYGPFSPWNMTSWNRSNNLCHAAPHPSFTPTTYSSFALWLLILESFMEPLKLTPILPNDGTFVTLQNLILR